MEVGLTMFAEDGRRYVTGFIRDVTERLAAEEKLRHLATHDPLTGLANADPLAEAADWQRNGLDLAVAVNLSAVDLRQPHLVADVRAAIAASGCEPARVIVELTESAVAEDPDEAVTRLRALKDLGVSRSLDDFGTGYSSLSYLRRFPIDTLKIDRSFVTDTPHDPDAVAIARTIVALAHSLGMSTVAEGVENRAQAGFLRDLGVDVLQGYLYSPPIPPNQFRTLATAGVIDIRP